MRTPQTSPKTRAAAAAAAATVSGGWVSGGWSSSAASRGGSPSHASHGAHGSGSPASPSHNDGADGRHGIDHLKNQVDNLIDEIVAGCNHNTPRGKAESETWGRAKQAHTELRATLADRGWRHPQPQSQHVGKQTPSAGFTRQQPHSSATAASSALLFPGDWWRALSSEPLAALIVDSFASAFCDALLDSCVLTLEDDEGWAPRPPSSRLSLSASAPSLGGGLPNLSKPRALVGTPQFQRLGAAAAGGSPSERSDRLGLAGLARRSLDVAGERPVCADGFTQGGLPKESLEAWNMRRYHACKQLDPYKSRIEQATELQRPKRHLPRGLGPPFDHRKFNWPMAKSNFPDEWNDTTRRRRTGIEGRGRGGASAGPAGGDAPGADSHSHLLGTDKDGKTTFPYSLALHKAFLESQADPALRAKAMKAAPLKITTAGFY